MLDLSIAESTCQDLTGSIEAACQVLRCALSNAEVRHDEGFAKGHVVSHTDMVLPATQLFLIEDGQPISTNIDYRGIIVLEEHIDQVHASPYLHLSTLNCGHG